MNDLQMFTLGLTIFVLCLAAVLRGVVFFLQTIDRHLECKHRFAIQDLTLIGDSDSTERVSWACWKCGKVFKAKCGLDVYKHGIADNSKGETKWNLDG